MTERNAVDRQRMRCQVGSTILSFVVVIPQRGKERHAAHHVPVMREEALLVHGVGAGHVDQVSRYQRQRRVFAGHSFSENALFRRSQSAISESEEIESSPAVGAKSVSISGELQAIVLKNLVAIIGGWSQVPEVRSIQVNRFGEAAFRRQEYPALCRGVPRGA